MIIGVDGNEANVVKKVGVSFYTYNILSYFRKKASKNLQFRVFLRKKPLEDMPLANRYFKYEVVYGPFLWSQFFLPLRFLFKRDVDVFFSPAHYLPRFCPIPSVVTIHDLSFHRYPEDFLKKDLFKLRLWTKYSIKKASRIISVSKTTKKDLMKIYNVNKEKISVIYNGYEKKISRIKSVSTKKIQEWGMKTKNYVLYVGTLQPRKNIATLVRAFSRFKKIYPRYELVIAGKKGWLYNSLFKEVGNLGLNNSVFFTDYITDKQLSFLYRNAFCFVLPSFYEGFGIPVLEAMSYDCPVIASFSSSLPEVGGNACLYFNPKSEDDLLEKLKMLKEDKKLKAELIKKGRKRITLFSWKESARRTLNVLRKVCQSK